MSSTVVADTGTPFEGLVAPVQASNARRRLNAPAGTANYALQAGYIWSQGIGVPQNLELGRLWFMEARRLEPLGVNGSGASEMLREYQITDPLVLLEKGQRYAGDSEENYETALFYFGRAASINDVQGMAALAYMHELRGETLYQFNWCRNAYRAARVRGFLDVEIDAVTYFCPRQTFDDMVQSNERQLVTTSTRRAQSSSEAIRRDVERLNDFARSVSAGMSGNASAHSEHDPALERYIENNIRRDCIASGSTMC